MSNKQGKSRKPLIVGIIAAVVVLAVLLVLLLTQCTGGGEGETTTAPSTTQGEDVVETYDLYWNVDRAEYDGKSEAGMSSRQPGEDGYFHVRFFKDGEIVELKVADRKTVNAIEINDLMGLEFDENGIVIGMIPVDELSCEQLAWQFYVQSAGGKLIKTNSSATLNGMEVLIETGENTGIWDMTGLSGDIGCDATPIPYDRVLVIGNKAGEVTHVFIYERSNYMRTHEAECEHCGKVVEWSEWTKTNAIPSTSGHYQLMNDITTTGQTNMVEDAEICLDLNGKRIDGKSSARVYSLHNPGTSLAIMDTSEAKTGTIAAHGKGDQGMCVWLRYGEVYLYDGILDGSDATTIKNGTTVALQANTYMYMYGGEIIGGTSTYGYNESTGKYTYGLGGAMALSGACKFTMEDGIIRDGFAEAVVTKWSNGQPAAYERGIGGNIFMSNGSTMIMNGGTIKNGKAGNMGGNIYMDGTADLTINGGTISGGKLTGKGKNGGNIYVTSKATLTINGGSIVNGSTRNCGGNLYLNGTVTMNGGYIGGGKIYSWSNGKLNATSASRNVFNVNGKFYMYGGSIDGGFQAIDTNAEKTETIVYLSGYATIASKTAPNMTISGGGSGVKVMVGTMLDGASVGVTTSVGLFSQVTKQSNQDNFFSDIEDAEICYVEERLGLGRMNCLCGSTTDEHKPGCDGTVLFWAPWTSTNSLPTTTGNYYLVGNVTTSKQATIAADSNVVLDLNGKTVTGPDGTRIYSLHYRTETVNADGTTTYGYNSKLTITDTSAEQTGKLVSRGSSTNQASLVWLRYGDFTLIAGTLDASAYTLKANWTAGEDGIWGTKDDTTSSRGGSAIEIPTGRTFTMYGGAILGGTVDATLTNDNVETDEEGNVISTETVSKSVGGCHGGTMNLSGNFYMYGGTISGGYMEGGTGGNIRINGNGKMYMYGGTVTSGTSTGNGGNIQLTGLLELHGGTIENGWSKNTAGNLHVSPGTLTMYGGTITGGKSGSSGNATSDNANIFVVNGTWNLFGGTVNGYARVINYNTDGAEGGSTMNIKGSPVVSGGVRNVVLAPQDDKKGENDDGKTPTMPIINVVGAMGENADVKLTLSNYAVDFGVGEGYTVTASDGKAFTSDNAAITTCAAADTSNNSLFFGKLGCLCGKEEHTFGCESILKGENLKWRPWTSTTSLPTSGNWYLTGKVTGSGTTTVGKDATLNLDLNGFDIERAWRAYRIYNKEEVAGSTLTITNTSETEATIRTTTTSGTDQGIAVWVAGGEKGTFNLLDNVVLDGSVYNLENVPVEENGAGSTEEKNGGVVSVGSSNTFNMYGGTIIGANGVKADPITLSNGKTYTAYAPNGASVYVDGVMNMYGGTIRDGKTQNQGGNLLITGDMYMYGGTISGGEGSNSGNIFVHRRGELHMSGDAQVLGGTTTGNSGSIRVDGKMTMTGNALVSGGKAGTNSGNILVNIITSGGVTYYGSLEMSGDAKVTDGYACDGNAGNIRVLTGATLTMTDNAVVSGGTCAGDKGDEPSGGNIALEGGSATLSGNAKVVDGKSYHTGGNIRVSSGSTLTIQDNAQVSGGQMTNSKSDTSKTMTEAHSSSNIFVVNGKVNFLGGTITGNVNVLNSTASNTAEITLSGNVTIQEGASGYGMTIGKVSKATELPSVNIVGALTGGEGAISIYTGTTGKFAEGKDYTLTDTDAAAFHATQLGNAVGCTVIREDNTLVIGQLRCLCGQEEHTKACLELWNGEQRVWLAWTSTTSLPTNGNYYLTGDVSVTKVTSIAVGADLNLDLNGYNITSTTRAFRAYNADSVVGGSLTIVNTGAADETHGVIKTTMASGTDQGGVIWFAGSEKSTFNLLDGVTLDASGYKLTNNNKEKNGGTVSIGSTNTFNMYGGTIIGANCVIPTQDGKNLTYASKGGAVAIESGTMNMYGGLITGGSTERYGGNVFVSGTLNMYGGEISQGTGRYGGNVYLTGGSVMNMSGGTISGGKTTSSHGGNVYVAANVVLNLSGGEILDGQTSNLGGNVYANGTINMTGGTIKGGLSKSGAPNANSNVSLVNGKLNISGGEIVGHVEANSYNSVKGAVITVSGSARITGSTQGVNLVAGDDKADDGITATRSEIIIEGTLNDDAMISIHKGVSGFISGQTVEANVDNFASDLEDAGICYVDGCLYVGKTGCVCGATDGNHNSDICDGTIHVWAPTSTVPTASGYYYLTDNMTIGGSGTGGNKALVADGLDITIDLNGYNMTSSAGRIYTTYGGSSAATNGKLNLMFTNTSSKDSTIKVTGTGDQGRIVWMRGENKTVTVYNVDIDMSQSTTKSGETDPKNGQAFAMDEQKSGNTGNYLNLYNVDITGGTRAANGGLIYADWNAHILMKDSSITNASVTVAPGATTKGGNGGAIFLQFNATLEMIDSSITGCTAEKLGGAIYTEDYSSGTGPKLTFSGKVVIEGNELADGTTSNIHMSTGATIVIGADGLDAGSSIGLTGTAEDVLSTTVTSADRQQFFFADDSENYQLAVLEGNLTLQSASAHIHCVCAGTQIGQNGHVCEDIVYTAMDATGGTITANKNWYLADDLVLTAQLGSGKNTMNLCLNGHNITTSKNERMIRTYGSNQTNGKITLTTCQADVYTDGKLTNNTVSQKENTLSDNGDGGIFWITNNGTFEMYAGTLDASMYTLKPNANDSAKHGCAVKVEYGSVFNMYGGTIIGGTTLKGTKNNSEGPSVFLVGSMTMYGGTIRDGETAAGSGGNVFVNGGSFTMHGGTISGGTAANNGGNIFACDRTSGDTTFSATVLINGGTITGGTAGNRGGNIFASCDGLTISGGTISGGTAKDGGNFSMATGKTVTMTGGTVVGGNATSAGGNAYLMGTLNMSGGTIKEGSKGTDKNMNHTGANVNMNASAVLNMSGGTIAGRVTDMGSASAGAKLNLSGTAKIYDTEKTNNLYINAMIVTVGDLTGDAKIGLLYNEGRPALDAAFATAADGYTITEEDAARFVFSNASYQVELSEDGKQLITRKAN